MWRKLYYCHWVKYFFSTFEVVDILDVYRNNLWEVADWDCGMYSLAVRK